MVVADDGSTDGTSEMLARIDTPFTLRPVKLMKRGPSAARNAGALAAQGRVYIFLDDDVIATPELVAEHISAHAASVRVMGIGRLTHVPAQGWYPQELAAYWRRHYDSLSGRAATWADGWGGNLSVARADFAAVDGFSVSAPAAAADIELAFRLQRVGVMPVYLPRAHGLHDDGKGGARLLDNARRRGAADVELARGAPAITPLLLGCCRDTSDREMLVRQILHRFRIPPTGLALLGAVIRGSDRRKQWFQFVSRYAFWLGARAAGCGCD